MSRATLRGLLLGGTSGYLTGWVVGSGIFLVTGERLETMIAVPWAICGVVALWLYRASREGKQ